MKMGCPLVGTFVARFYLDLFPYESGSSSLSPFSMAGELQESKRYYQKNTQCSDSVCIARSEPVL
jgi:hypothetical protein